MEKQIHWGSGRQEKSGSSGGGGLERGKWKRWRVAWRSERESAVVEMVGEDERKSRGEKEKEVGSRDELKHPVPG